MNNLDNEHKRLKNEFFLNLEKKNWNQIPVKYYILLFYLYI